MKVSKRKLRGFLGGCSVAAVVLGMLAFLPAAAQASEKLDCIDDLINLGYAARFNVQLVAQGPLVASDPSEQAAVDAELARQLSIRKALGIRVWVAYWNYNAGLYAKAQFAVGQYQVLYDSLVADGLLDPDVSGQPDFSALAAAATSCTNSPPEPLTTGLQYMQSGEDERNYYLQLPADYDDVDDKPLVIALHGTGGTHLRWIDEQLGYDLIGAVGDDAVMVFPNALPDANGSQQWSFSYDVDFFLDMLADLDLRGLKYNKNKIFVTGHSSGAGMAHEIGCRLGDVVRAIAPSAGTLIGTQCVGSVAVLMSQGLNDQLVKYDIATGGRRFWVLYNGYDLDASTPGEVPPCVDYSLLGSANTPYPVYWCEHTEGSLSDFSGHRWASFAGEAVWSFFSSLPEVEPATAAPPGGGNDRAQIPSDTTITFSLKYPDDIARPLDGAITLYSEEYLANPTFAIPSVFLNPVFPVGQVGAGDTVTYTVPISFFVFSGDPVAFPSTWTLSINIYVEGGTRPTPTAGLDHQHQQLITFGAREEAVVVPGVLELQPAACFFNCAP